VGDAPLRPPPQPDGRESDRRSSCTSTSLPHDAITASWSAHPLLYLVLAALFLLVALRFMKRALAPVGALVQAVAAAALVAVSIGAALVLVAVAAFTTH
jgi:hypothetical protein